jgi:hypothetical protein
VVLDLARATGNSLVLLKNVKKSLLLVFLDLAYTTGDNSGFLTFSNQILILILISGLRPHAQAHMDDAHCEHWDSSS